MQVLTFLGLFGGAILASSGGVVYKPCELVEDIRNTRYFRSHLTPDQLPLITCIAGYRHYNSSYRLEKVRNKTGYYGIFGLHNNDVNRTECLGPGWDISSLLDGKFEDDLICLKEIILDSPLDLKFYQEMCSPSMVRNIPCPVTSYVQADLFDPIDQSLFEKAFKKGGLPIPPSPPSSATPTPCCCCESGNASNYWALYITVPAILIALTYFAVSIAMKRRANQEPSLINA